MQCCSCSVFTIRATCDVISPVKYILYLYISTFRSKCAVSNVSVVCSLVLLLYDMDVSCHRPFLPGISLEPAVTPTAQASSFTLQYYAYYV